MTGQSINPRPIEQSPVPRTAEHIQRLKDERREEILRAALRVFARKGLSASKISDIAAAAGLSHGLVYHYFESKEAVFAALLFEVLDATEDMSAPVRDRSQKPVQRLRALLDAWLARAEHEPEVLLLLLQGVVSDTIPAEVQTRMDEFHETFYLPLVSLMQDGQADGTIVASVPAPELTATLIAMLHGMAIMRLMIRHGAKRVDSPPEFKVETILRLFAKETTT